MSGVTIKLEGMDVLNRRLEALGREFRAQAIEDALISDSFATPVSMLPPCSTWRSACAVRFAS